MFNFNNLGIMLHKYEHMTLVALLFCFPFLLGVDYKTHQASQLHDITRIHPVAIVALVITVAFMLKLPRDKAILPFFIMIMLVSMNQVIAIFSLDFFIYRILIIAGLIRLTICSEFYPQTKNKIDKTIFLLVISICVVYILQWQTVSAIIYRAGYALDIIGSYILFRSLIRDIEDIDRLIKTFVFISLIIATIMIIEQITQINITSFFGGVSKYTGIRDGKIRSEAALGHPILAGTFGAIMLPLFVYLWTNQRQSKSYAILGIFSSTIIAFTSSSSGPILTYIAAMFALFLYPLRQYIRVIKWGLLFSVVSLHLYMKAPVWSLLDRVSVFGSSTAYHRFVLVDQFIRRFDEWWLLGIKSTEQWNELLQMWDITNQFVRIGIDGGFLSLFLFISAIFFCFNRIGCGIRALTNDKMVFLFWALGAMFFSNITAFMGVSYYGQMLFIWILTISIISSLSDLSNHNWKSNQETIAVNTCNSLVN